MLLLIIRLIVFNNIDSADYTYSDEIVYDSSKNIHGRLQNSPCIGTIEALKVPHRGTVANESLLY